MHSMWERLETPGAGRYGTPAHTPPHQPMGIKMTANRAQSPSFEEIVPSQDGLLYQAIQELRETLIQINEVIEEGLTPKLRPVLTQEDSLRDPDPSSKPLHSSAPLYSEFADLHERAVGIRLKLNQLRDDIIL